MTDSVPLLLLNTEKYVMAHLGFMLVSQLSWIAYYVLVFRNMRRHGVVEIPAAAVASNLAFVTVWGVLGQSDLGYLFTWANRGMLLLQMIVFWFLLKNGSRHIRLPEVRRWFNVGMIVSYLSWLLMLATFAHQKYDVPGGLVSAFIAALFMSSLYVLIELSEIDASQYSLAAGWAKLVANASASLFCALVYPRNHFLLTLCVITVVLDVTYLLVFRLRRLASPSRAPV